MSNEIIVSEEYIRATELHKQIKASIHCAKTAFLEIGKSLKQMRDGKLYKELDYQNFEEYCEAEVEISRRHAYNLISIIENLPEDFVHSVHKIGVIKLATLATLPFEQVQEVVEHIDVESVTVKELKAEVAALREDKTNAEEQLAKKDRECQIAVERAKNELQDFKEGAERRRSALIEKNQQLSGQITELEHQVKELESRPAEVAVSEEAEKKAAALEKRLSENEIEWTTRMKDLKREHAEEIREIELKLAEAQKGKAQPDTTEIFKVYYANAIDVMDRLMDFIEEHREDDNLNFFLKKVDALLDMTDEKRADYGS